MLFPSTIRQWTATTRRAPREGKGRRFLIHDEEGRETELPRIMPAAALSCWLSPQSSSIVKEGRTHSHISWSNCPIREGRKERENGREMTLELSSRSLSLSLSGSDGWKKDFHEKGLRGLLRTDTHSYSSESCNYDDHYFSRSTTHRSRY